jgi:quercetin dioxygenase-like cupin family protein
MNPLLSRQVVHTAACTLARLELKAGAVVPMHSHINEQISMILAGRLVFRGPGGEHVASAGLCVQLPPNEPHSVEVLEDAVVLDLFVPPREDWIRGEDAYLRAGR